MRQLVFLYILLIACFASAQKEPIRIPLWGNGAPGFEHNKDIQEKAADYWVKNIHNPSITVFSPQKPNGSAVLIFPGGGHRLLVFDEEGNQSC